MGGDGEQTQSRSTDTTTDETDTQAKSIVDIEQELADIPGTDADVDETEATGNVTEVQKLSAESVPDAYPVAIDGSEAVGLRVQITVDRETMVYLAWPETYDESADLACLLNDLGIAPDRFADIIGKEIDLVVLEGQWIPAVAAESARPHPAAGTGEIPTIPDEGSSSAEPEVVMNDGTAAVVRDEDGTRVVSANRVEQGESTDQSEQIQTAEPTTETETNPDYYYGVLTVGGLWTAVLFGLLTGFHVVPTAVTGLLLLGSPILFPFFIYRDAEHVSANSEWSPHIAWTIGSVFWLVNTFVFFGYLYKRRNALPDA